MYRQYWLQQGDLHTTAWLDTDAPLRVGQRLTTKEHGPEVVWIVTAAGTLQLISPPDTRWRVGGLA